MQSVVYRQNRRFFLLSSLVCLGSVAFGVLFMLPDPGTPWWKSWFVVAASGLGLLVSALMLIHPMQLLLNQFGFALSGGLSINEKLIEWHHVDEFFLYHQSGGSARIGFNYVPHFRPDTVVVKLNGAMGAQGSIPGGFTIPPEILIDELTAWHRKALGKG